MIPKSQCAQTLFAINFETRNALDEGEYFDGLAPTCEVNDEPKSDLWSEDDALYSAGIDYLVNNSCAIAAQRKTLSTQTNLSISPIHPKQPDWDMF
jgi:hypothetical protein